MSGTSSSLVDLPLDILVQIFPYLDARSFLHLCSTCKAFNSPSIRLDASYWRHVTRATFRVPNQPVIEGDGSLWQKLFRRMLTQSHVFTWGQNTHGCLGHFSRASQPGRMNASHCPLEMEKIGHLGTIADLQCGGWSTVLLTSSGLLYLTGAMNPEARPVGATSYKLQTVPLRFPDGLRSQGAPTMNIRQFSTGRSHVLGVSDSGRIWSWYNEDEPALHIKLLHADICEREQTVLTPSGRASGRVRRVVAGWGDSSAYISGTGIVLWTPAEREFGNHQMVDTTVVTYAFTVPRTDYLRPQGSMREPDETTRRLGQEVGEVVNHILLEHWVVFVTDVGKVFCYPGPSDDTESADILELDSLPGDQNSPASDVQGSFRWFAILRANGEVITCRQDDLIHWWSCRFDSSYQSDYTPTASQIPALQHTGVTSLAFGDWHFHALHKSGHITSYGKELQRCGALGLVGEGVPEYLVRGVFTHVRDGKLVRHSYTTGRRVWFEPEKRMWIRFMSSGGKNIEEAANRIRMMAVDEATRGEVSEWFEQEGRDWDKHPDLADADEDGLGAYFALTVAAAGWHSGALVLVNEKLAERVRQQCIVPDETAPLPAVSSPVLDSPTERSGIFPAIGSLVGGAVNWAFGAAERPEEQGQHGARPVIPPSHPSHFTNPMQHGASPGPGFKYRWADDSFPRLKLADGREMPGEVPFSEWRFGRPDFQLEIGSW